jgi:hypothetical protein
LGRKVKMKVVEKIKLIDDIAYDLQQRYTYSEIDVFMAEFDVGKANLEKSYNSKRTYVTDCLKGVSNKELKKIADELDISTDNIIKTPPKNWGDTKSVKLFISHIAKDKGIAIRLRDALKAYNIEAFVAHEDIRPSEEWQIEIERALKTMDFFVSIHTKGVKESIWCQQEIGWAACRNVKMIPIKFDEDPQGFIGKIQALIRGNKSAEAVAKNIIEILKDDEKTRDLYQEKIGQLSTDFDDIPF